MMPASSPAHDLLITSVEVNDHHGVGILLRRFFPDSGSFVTLRSATMYGGNEPFGSAHHELVSRHLTVVETEARLRTLLAPYNIRRILCVPYYREEFVHGVLARKITGAPLCSYLMDDQNIYAPHVPDHWVAALLQVSDLRLGISPEMCEAYAQKYDLPFHLLPPVLRDVPAQISCYWNPAVLGSQSCAMLGNVWTARRLEQLRALSRAARLQIDWYGNGPKAPWLAFEPDQWAEDGLHAKGHLPEEELVAVLASYPFVLIPSGGLDREDDNPAFSRLSLPSRLIFVTARINIPILVAGSPDTAAGQFVTHLGIGLCAPYQLKGFKRVLRQIKDPRRRRLFSQHAYQSSPALSMRNPGQWLWDSLASRQPQPADFAHLFPTLSASSHARAAEFKPSPAIPPLDQPFSPAQIPAFAFSRNDHFPLISDVPAPKLPEWSQALELTHYQRLIAAYLLHQLNLKSGYCLFLDENVPSEIAALASAGLNIWSIRDLNAWAAHEYSTDAACFRAAHPADKSPGLWPGRFSAIVSTGFASNFPEDPRRQTALTSSLARLAAPAGWNLHFFNAVLHPNYFWKNPIYDIFRQRLMQHRPWPGLDEVLSTDLTFFMSEQAYARYWQPTVKKSYQEFGRPFSLALIWQNPAVGGTQPVL